MLRKLFARSRMANRPKNPKNPTNPSDTERLLSPSSSERAERASYARGLLETGLRTATAATMISARFSCSRSTAYRVLTEASNELQLSDDGPADSETSQAIEPSDVAAQLQHLFNIACAQGDTKQVCQLLRGLDTVRKWSAPLQSSSGYSGV